MKINFEDRLTGVLLGTMLGDSLGLPFEGVKPRYIPESLCLKQRLVLSKGMLSDDSEHTFMVGNALLESGDAVAVFKKRLASKPKWWILPLPAGVGMATARSIIKLWLGWGPDSSGVFSAGNGPAMRSALIGVYYSDDDQLRTKMVSANTTLTHSDPKADVAAQAISECAASLINLDLLNKNAVRELLDKIKNLAEQDDEWTNYIDLIIPCLENGDSVLAFSKGIGCSDGITGYAYHTAPCALYTILKYPNDFEKGLTEIIKAGGDADTTAAIVGALYGSYLGGKNMPKKWLNSILEWPRTVSCYRDLAINLSLKKQKAKALSISFFFPGIIMRNILFLIIVLIHGFIRPVWFLAHRLKFS